MKQENQNIWVSVEDLNNEPEFVERSKQEFFELPVVEAMSSDENVIEEATKNSNRRDFLKYMGFGLTAATIAASCETPVRKAIPYVVKPDAIVPGVATYYASTFVKGGDVCPVVIKTREGRPIKIEGNVMSAMTGGGTSARVQASILELYDTARVRKAAAPNKKGKVKDTSWDKLDEKIKGELKPDASIRIVTSTIVSPSINAAIEDFKVAYPNTQVVTYDAVSASGLLDANEENFGQRVVPSYDFSAAKVVATFGADFLGTWISPIEYAAGFAKARKANKDMMRLYALESGMSLTGSNADHRIFVKPSEQGQAVLALYNEIAKAKGESSVSAQKLSYAKSNPAIKEMAKDLLAANGSIVISNSNDKNVQVVVNKINDLLGNYGKTISFANHSNQRQGDDKAVSQMIADMKAGKVDAVIINDANPVYDAPNASEFAAGLKKVKTVISCDSWFTETSEYANYLAPQTHFLESWGDAEAKKGHFSVIQPTIAPLHENRQFIESLLVWAGAEMTTAHDYVKNLWSSTALAGALDTTMAWDNALHDGVVNGSVGEAVATFAGDVSAAAAKVEKGGKGIEVSFYESVNIGGGQYANNPWLQEMPDPINRTVWDNVLMIPVSWSADKGNYVNAEGFEGLKDGDKIELTVGKNTFETVVVRQFGQMPGTASIALGYGRTEGGRVAKGVGNDVTPMLSTYKDGSRKYFATGAKVSSKTGEDKDFACVQMHHTMGVYDTEKPEVNVDEKLFAFQGSLTKRSIIRTANLSELDTKIDDLKHEREHHQKLNNYSLYDGHDYDYEQGHHWGMNVDLSACIGCGACQVACVAENNVPMVGKHEVSIHHEMTWIRIDRYFYGDVENPSVVYQPMMCQHCDNAPCENVCPVAATNHSSEGLNQMTYNRCIGTRYCANNCPYKVRRFNWLDYTTADLFAWNEPGMGVGGETPYYADNLTRMVLNPDVTVRSRGVIEKCSFCVQRIQEAKLTAKIEKRKLRDGDLKVACQTACPTGAITFGDMNDKNSEISRELAADRTYKVLEEVNTASSVGYQMRISNKNEKIG
jgi:molybdopterin-containing oxidoreductase family iron-sulfur binding subunit